MIPGLLSSEVAQALREFIVTGYETETPPFAGEFRRLVEEQQGGEAFLKGPYISIGLPFRQGSDALDWFEAFNTSFPPYIHQLQAWERLSSNKQSANTLIATGTGSGKTECFLYPLLDHCHRHRGPGIKAIVIYPMNALASDQAKRFATVIDSQPNLKGLRVGLFVGGNDSSPQKRMTGSNVIACKETLRETPPDILLTNYKMLDYLLMRPKDQSLWAHNGTETLQYLVVDELHTFDGAQGTDLALLIRRLRARLELPEKHLINVGTSATLGDITQGQGLLDYASEIFSSDFTTQALIGEARQDEGEFIGVLDYLSLNGQMVPKTLNDALLMALPEYLAKAYELVFCESSPENLMELQGRIGLGEQLRSHGQIQNILRRLDGGVATLQELTVSLLRRIPKTFSNEPSHAVLALLSLLAHARQENGQPLVQLRVQLWSRELRRIVALLAEPEQEDGSGPVIDGPLISYADDQPLEEHRLIRLPLVQCRECHGTAWLGRIEAGPLNGKKIISSLPDIYSAFFSRHAETAVLLPWIEESQEVSTAGQALRLCRYCGTMSDANSTEDCKGCQASAKEHVRVFRPHMNKERSKGGINVLEHDPHCPFCQASGGLIVFGARAPSLSAVAIHRMFSSRDNDDKKLLTFSDSVQDAAHRAGFFSARTWQNNIRMALAQLLDATTGDIPILSLPERFEEFWLDKDGSGGKLSLEHYLREFMPPDRRYQSAFKQFEETGRVAKPGNLLRQICFRMLWEAMEDLAWRMQVGRSLNRVGLATIDWPVDALEMAAVEWCKQVYNDLGYSLGEVQAFQFFNGLILHMVQLGALGFDFLDSYRVEGGRTYVLSKLDFTPRIGPPSPRPHYPGTKKEYSFEQIIARGDSWYQRWLKSVQPEGLIDAKQEESILMSAFKALVGAGFVREGISNKGSVFWSLAPEMFVINKDPLAVSAQGQRTLHISPSQAEHWLHIPVISAVGPHVCYEQIGPVRPSLYQSLYKFGQVHRVIAHEHTGLLPREERERIENSFIKGEKPWEYNLLSATPTLEMGIDIGDLSSVLLCSVPPAQANYLQRVGRGGRKDGNSFVLTVANGRPHDLVFYAEPRRMLESPVEPPAVFLKARHVLRRQLLAYAMDCWTKDNDGQNEVPYTLQPVLDAVESHNGEKFPYTLLDYVKTNMQEIWQGFSDYVAEGLTEDDQESLRQFLFGGPQYEDAHLQLYVNGRLQQVVEERRSISENIKNLQKQIKALKKGPQDEHSKEELLNLNQELEGYQRLRRRLNRRETLNFFTDEGLLPNYAFPEEGATLHSIIFHTLTDQDSTSGAERELVRREFEYQRPAQAALSELAPESVFYAGDRRVSIDRVETARGKNIQAWRFCPDCNYSTPQEDPKGGFNATSCPRCGSAMWSDQSARTEMLKMTQVYAFTSERAAQLDDRSDDREPAFFTRQLLIDFEPKEIAITWALENESRPFGFEFIRSANFLEVNFGRRDVGDEPFDVAGQTLNRSGFPICRYCGTVQEARKAPKHMKSCIYHAGPRESKGEVDDGIVNCLYLYRQFSSEALRILLPRLSTGGTEEQIHSFIAALQLGLKKRYGGKVDHLRVAHQSEPSGRGEDRRHFLVLYDSVPGGTGYLHELLSEVEHMKSIFEQAYEVMQACDCYEGTMDGCYRCLLEYRNSYGMEHTSKRVALEMLTEIVDGKHNWVISEKGLSELKGSPWVDSELEARFPKALETFSGHALVAGEGVRIRRDVVRRKNGFRLSIGEREYACEPHVLLGQKDGIRFNSEADFIFWPPDKSPPVAIFLDGYEYHQQIVQEDLLKRQALMHAGFVVWSLNWYDINQVLGDKARNVPLLSGCIAEDHAQSAVNALGRKLGISEPGSWASLSGFERLMSYLRNPDIERQISQAWLFTLMAIPQSQLPEKAIWTRVKEEYDVLPSGFTDLLPEPSEYAAQREWFDTQGVASLSFRALLSEKALKEGDAGSAGITLCYDIGNASFPDSLEQWQRFWTAVTAMQFLPVFYAYTPESISSGIAAGLEWPTKRHDDDSAQKLDASYIWMTLLDDEFRESLLEAEIDWPSLPEVGYELTSNSGEVIGEAELALPNIRLAILTDGQQEYEQVFSDMNWTVVKKLEELKITLAEYQGENSG